MGEGVPVRVVVVAASPSTRLGLRALLGAAEGVDVVEAIAPDEWLISPPEDAEAVLVAEVSGDRDVLAAFEEAGAGGPAVYLGARAETFDGVPRRRALGLLLDTATGEELRAAVLAVAEGLVVLDPLIAASEVRAGRGSNTQLDAETLSERERQVLLLLAEGLPNKGIALRLGVSESTAKFHVGSILSKLNAGSRTEAVTIAARSGLLPL